MKITIVNSHPKYLIGGAELFMFYCAREFVRQGHEVSMVSVYPRGMKVAVPSSVEVLDGIRIFHVRDVATDVASAWRFVRTLAKIKTDVYLKMFTEPSTVLLAAYARLTGKPYVLFMAHDAHCLKDAGISVAARYRVGWLTRILMVGAGFYGWALGRADRMIVQNETQRKLLFEHFRIDADDIIKIGHPVPVSDIIKDDPPLVMWSARFQPWKRPEFFLELARRLPQIRFIVGGPTAEDAATPYYRGLEDAINKLPNVSVFPFPSSFDEFLRFPLYERASVFVDTIERGGFENTLVQAWLRRVPVVSLSRDFDGLFEREPIGIACHGDFERLVAEVERLIAHPSDRQIMGERTRQFATREYDVRPIATRLLWHVENARAHRPRAPFLGESDLPV